MTIDKALELISGGHPFESSCFMYAYGYYFSYCGIKYQLAEIEGDSLTLWIDEQGKRSVIEERSIKKLRFK